MSEELHIWQLIANMFSNVLPMALSLVTKKMQLLSHRLSNQSEILSQWQKKSAWDEKPNICLLKKNMLSTVFPME